MLLHSPKDMIAGLLAAAAVSAIIANALFLQAGRHPSPMFGAACAGAACLPIRCRARARSKPHAHVEPRTVEVRTAEAKPVEPRTPNRGRPTP